MTFDLTPTELNRLHTEGSVRVVRKMEHQPRQTLHDSKVWEYDKDLYVFGNPPVMSKEFVDATSPFPPAGTREVIDGIPCVWGESGCKQRDIFEKASTTHSQEWVWVGHIRKDTE